MAISSFNDEKASLDNYGIALNSDPNATGTIIVYAVERIGGTAQAVEIVQRTTS